MTSGGTNEGYPIVLTASRAEANEYNNNPFRAFICTFPKKLSGIALRKYLCHLESNPDGTAKRTIYGLRKIQSILIDSFGERNVIACHYDQLDRFIGSNTKIVGISTMDPMGLAYVSTTYNSLIGFGGEALNASEFEKLIHHPSILKYKPKIIVGGAGCWQIKEADKQEEFNIDVLFQGEAEESIVNIFKRLLNDEPVPPYVVSTKPKKEQVPLITYAASYGMVEITRGCGRGCAFCSPTMRKKYSFPIDHILKEVAVNVNGGSNTIFTVSEDIFLYNSKQNFIPNREALIQLYTSIANFPGVEYILLSHASFAPIIKDPLILEELTPILMEKTKWCPEFHPSYKNRFISVEVGIETGSTRLMNKHMKGKALPYSVDNWPELVLQGVGLFNDHDWYPLCTFMTGQPDETEEDVIQTLNLIDDLKNQQAKMFYTPVLFIPLNEAILKNQHRTKLDTLSELQWEVIARCWKNNIDFWTPDKKRLLESTFFASHWLYARWRHGRKATRPMMHLAGFPLNGKIGKQCDPLYCETLENNNYFKERLEEIKNKYFS